MMCPSIQGQPPHGNSNVVPLHGIWWTPRLQWPTILKCNTMTPFLLFTRYIDKMPNNRKDDEEPRKTWNKIKATFHDYVGSEEELSKWADSVVQSIWRPVAVGIVIGIPAAWAVSRFVVGKRYKTAGHIPPEVFEKATKIRGKVVAVGDSDNFRLYHTPGLGWGWIRNIPKTRKELQNQTISIRIAGVDAPEAAHFGMPAQPFSAEAKQFLTKLVLNKRVQVQLLSRDQYTRVVGAHTGDTECLI